VTTEMNPIRQMKYDTLWKMRTIFDKLNTKETQMVWDKNLQVMLFYGIYIKHITVFRPRQKTCNCCNDCSSHNCVRTYYKDCKFWTQTLHGQYFSSPDLFNDLHMKAINCCGTVRPNRILMPSDIGRKLRLK
jgi:hypothetical protein